MFLKTIKVYSDFKKEFSLKIRVKFRKVRCSLIKKNELFWKLVVSLFSKFYRNFFNWAFFDRTESSLLSQNSAGDGQLEPGVSDVSSCLILSTMH